MYFLFLEIIKLLFWEIDYSQKCNIPMDELVFGRSSQCVGNEARSLAGEEDNWRNE